MATQDIRKQAIQDFNDKLALEPKLRKKLRKLDKKILNQFRRNMLRGQMTRADTFSPELEDLLAKHYVLVANEFQGNIENQLPKDLGLTATEKTTLALALAAFFERRATNQAHFITQTTQKEMGKAALLAASETEDQIEQAVIAAAILSRRFLAREGATATLETQAAAEATKAAEFDVLAGKRPLTLDTPPGAANKEWVTMRDERVRRSPFFHTRADQQVRPINVPFSVGGEQLRFPGDTSLGASIGNVINCRCAAIGDIDKLADLRAARFAT